MAKATIKIAGMSCGHCVMGVKSALKAVPGITDMQVQVGEAVIQFDGALNAEALKEAIAEEGYEVVSIS